MIRLRRRYQPKTSVEQKASRPRQETRTMRQDVVILVEVSILDSILTFFVISST